VPETTTGLADAPLDLLNRVREGTLFLHDVADLSKVEQKGLLLLIGKVDRYNARVICGATPALPELVAQGAFDARLYAALAAAAIRVPSLREHREDVPDLANLMLTRMVEAKEAPQRQFSTAALNALRNYDWPGNLAQLQSVVQTLAHRRPPSVEDVSRTAAIGFTLFATAYDLPCAAARCADAFERVYFEHHIAKEGGNISRVAETVGLERTHLYRKLKQLGIKLSRKPEE
jgi:DNA-binding NtrC family response regulator